MMFEPYASNVLSWMGQVLIIASVGALLPIVFRIRHPRTQLAYCHVLLLVCLLMPLVQPWRRPIVTVEQAGLAQADSVVETESPAPSEMTGARREAARRDSRGITPTRGAPQSPWTKERATRLVMWLLIAGALGRLCWSLAGLWQARKQRIAAMPLYPIPESVLAASAITHADALFCISSDSPGPVMLGWLAPVVLLPESFLELGEEAQCGVACHELLHVRRHDWLITVLEELAGALLWFNPAAWWLLAQARLAREQLVDAEVVRLTASREPYIDALLSLARQRPILDLAPAALFLRRRHLAKRMQSLLKEVSVSRLRLLTSYGSMAAILVFAGWFAVESFPLMGRPVMKPASARTVVDTPVAPVAPSRQESDVVVAQNRPGLAGGAFVRSDEDSVPVPPDSREPINGPIQVPATPADRATALSLLERARQNSNMHIQGSAPFHLRASFVAGGNGAFTGSGELTETWLSGQRWRWTANLGSYSQARIGSGNVGYDETPVRAVPMSVHLLRNAIFAPVRQVSVAGLRTAAIQWNRKPATCLLVSGMPSTATSTRLWEEQEYCVDNASGLLQVSSVAPGTYVVYGYGRNADSHGRLVPDQITVYVGGVTVLDAQLTIADAGSVAESLLTPTPEMTARGLGIVLEMPARLAIDVPSAKVSGNARPVIVLAEIDGDGHVMEAEVSSPSDPALSQTALDLVKNRPFPAVRGMQRQVYVNVRFVPATQ